MPSLIPMRVVCALIVDHGKVLLARRRPGQPHGGQWEFPGGKIKEFETPEDAIVREIQEELSIIVKPENRFSSVRHDYETYTVDLIAFVCSIVRGTPCPVDHDEIRWMDIHMDIHKELQMTLLPPDTVVWDLFSLCC